MTEKPAESTVYVTPHGPGLWEAVAYDGPLPISVAYGPEPEIARARALEAAAQAKRD